MRRTILALVLGLMFVFVGNVYAYPVNVNDIVVLTATSLGGGYYDTNGDWYGGGDFGVSLASDSSTVLFTTFCVEYDVHMSLNTSYKISSISDTVEDAGRTLNGGTKWLYWNFDRGTLGGATSNYQYDQAGVRALQEAIWALEGYGIDLSGLSKTLYDLGTTNSVIGAAYDVKVMNIEDSYGNDKQSQLVVAPVPEPATMLLLGSGLIGLAFYRRRMKK